MIIEIDINEKTHAKLSELAIDSIEECAADIVRIACEPNNILVSISDKYLELMEKYSDLMDIQIAEAIKRMMILGIKKEIRNGLFPELISDELILLKKYFQSALNIGESLSDAEMMKIATSLEASDGNVTDVFELIQLYQRKRIYKGKAELIDSVELLLP